MPASLMDMLGGNAPLQFSPRDYAGNQIGMGDAIAQNSNSLVGLGMGLLQPYRPGESPYAAALQGFQAGSVADSRRGYQQAQLQHQKAQEGRQARQDAIMNSLREREFARGGQTEFQKIQADIEKYGEPARQFYSSKSGDTSQITKITNPNTGEEESVLYNPRAPVGQQFKPLPPDIFGQPGATAPAATPGIAPAPLPVQPPDLGSTPTPFDPNAPVATAPAPPRGPADLPPRVGPKAFEPEEKLRKEFNAATKPHQEVRQSYQRLLAAKDNAAGDIALIFGYMRMLDPGSVVREGEFATAQNAAGIPDMVRNMYNRALSGERLNPTQRDQFKDQAGSIYEKYDQEYTARAEQFRQIAKQHRIDPSRVIPDLGAPPKAAEKVPVATAPKPGTVSKGYVFKGGDPSDQNNWAPVR
jgi:hypothetical protein